MKKGECFKIETVEELEKAYYMFGGRWFYSLGAEIMAFNKGCRYVKYDSFWIFLGTWHKMGDYNEIPSPVNNINNLNKLI